jgi:tetratricopeptide (TPR) repeat protein
MTMKIGFFVAAASIPMTVLCGYFDAESGPTIGWLTGALLGAVSAPFIPLGYIEGESWVERRAKDRIGISELMAAIGSIRTVTTFWQTPRSTLAFVLMFLGAWLAILSTALAYCPILPFHWKNPSQLAWPMFTWPVGGVILGILLGSVLCLFGAGQLAELKWWLARAKTELQDHPRDKAPIEWAKAQSSLGDALSALARKKRSVVLFEEAIFAYNGALSEDALDALPHKRFYTLQALANAHIDLFSIQKEPASLDSAVVLLREALLCPSGDDRLSEWCKVHLLLGQTLMLSGRSKNDDAPFAEAIKAFEAGLAAAEQCHNSVLKGACSDYLQAAASERESLKYSTQNKQSSA